MTFLWLILKCSLPYSQMQTPEMQPRQTTSGLSMQVHTTRPHWQNSMPSTSLLRAASAKQKIALQSLLKGKLHQHNDNLKDVDDRLLLGKVDIFICCPMKQVCHLCLRGRVIS